MRALLLPSADLALAQLMGVLVYLLSSTSSSTSRLPGVLVSPLGREDPHVWTDPANQSVGGQPEQRMAACCNLVAEAIDPAETEEIRIHLRPQQALGSPRFQAAIEAQLARRVTPGKTGIPPGARRQIKRYSDPFFQSAMLSRQEFPQGAWAVRRISGLRRITDPADG